MATIARVMGVPLTGAYYREELATRAADPIPGDLRTAPPGGDGLTVGLVLTFSGDDEHGAAITWCDCMPAVAHTEVGMHIVRGAAGPALEGREVSGFRPLVEALDAALDAEAARPDGLSRRDVIASPARVLRALHDGLDPDGGAGLAAARHAAFSAVRFGLAGALIHAAALSRGGSMTAALAAEWNLPAPAKRVPAAAAVDFNASPPGGGLVFVRSGQDLVPGLRELAARLAASHKAPPTIYLEAGGVPGQAVGNHTGRVLGKLFALEHAASPCPLIVEDPVVVETRGEQVNLIRTLRRYAQARRMSVRLAARSWVETPGDARAFVTAGAADVLRIDPVLMGGVDRAVEAMRTCRRMGIDTVLDAGPAGADAAARIAVHAALAVRPLALAAGDTAQLPLIRHEMAHALDEHPTTSP